ncbi:MAG TPA: hypothetical protein VGQ69_01310 [Gemmatimonadales bacterium]|jgi:hypothetical protein|nr:hypothetical protein [Gemmatimonadales bacterium]
MLERRGFLGALLGVSAAPWLVGRSTFRPSAEKWDLSWLDGLTGKHKQVFDFSNLEMGLVVVKNWYDAHEEVFGLKHPEVNAVVGIATRGFPVNASDQLYQKFPIGELWKVNDPETGKPALRNTFLEGGKTAPFIGAGVRALQARGAIFWMCNNALHGVASRIGDAVKRPEPEVYQELKAGLNPRVILIPAHTLLLGLCQDRGCAYESL